MGAGPEEFVIVNRRTDLPFRSRALLEGYALFMRDEDCVLVHPQAQAILCGNARRALPKETGGLLVGRILRDDMGTYVVVVGAVTAPPDAGRRGSFELSPAMTTSLRDKAARLYPGADVIGWWHTHTHWSGYSSVDRENQRLWTDQQHLGLLVFAKSDGDDWAKAYFGPNSREAHLMQDAVPPEQPIVESHDREQIKFVRHRVQPGRLQTNAPESNWIWKTTVVWLAIGLAIVALLVALALDVASRQEGPRDGTPVPKTEQNDKPGGI